MAKQTPREAEDIEHMGLLQTERLSSAIGPLPCIEVNQFLPNSFHEWQLVGWGWGDKGEDQLEVGDVEKVGKEAQVNSRTHSISESTPALPLTSAVIMITLINHCKFTFLQLQNRNIKRCFIILWCKLNKAMFAKHLTLCPMHNEGSKMVALVSSMLPLKERSPDKCAGKPEGKVVS